MKRSWRFICVLLSLFVALPSADAVAKETESGKLLSIFQVQVRDGESFIATQAAAYQSAVLTSRLGKILIVAREHVPQSIGSAKLRAQDDGVSGDSVKVKRWNDRALFHYETADHIHVYSTVGGHLVISKKAPFKFDLERLSLVENSAKRSERKAARL